MIKFVNLKTGNIYTGSDPYIHWFDGQQSTNLVYVQPLCFICDSEAKISMSSNDVFALADLNALDSTIDLNDVEYYDLSNIKKYSINSAGWEFGNKFIHIVYFIGSSSVGAEFVEKFTITCGRKDYHFNIGADFYQEDEKLTINLNNFGSRLPESIQKAIYESNVHEEKNDNILLNRKFKELLANYWDILANRGSYKSLINSLKWFEYGDLVRINEIWKHDDEGRVVFGDEELNCILTDDTKLSNFAKTTYYALFLALQKEKTEVDDEFNPKLENITFKWSLQDMSLKMCLLGNFLETYFMPIHLDLYHSTIEDLVFTNTIKVISNTTEDIYDFVNCDNSFQCTINNGKEVVLSNINVGVGEDTIFGNRYVNDGEHNDYASYKIVGAEDIKNVKIDPKNNNDETLKTFYAQNYNGIGNIVPISCDFVFDPKDVIKYGDIVFNGTYVQENNILAKNIIQHKKYGTPIDEYLDGFTKRKHNITFYVLVTPQTTEYDIKLHFVSAGGKHYSKDVKFTIKDISNVNLSLYKIKHRKDPLESIDIDGLNSYTFTRLKVNDSSNIETYSQYLPSKLNLYLKNDLIVYRNYADSKSYKYVYAWNYFSRETNIEINRGNGVYDETKKTYVDSGKDAQYIKVNINGQFGGGKNFQIFHLPLQPDMLMKIKNEGCEELAVDFQLKIVDDININSSHRINICLASGNGMNELFFSETGVFNHKKQRPITHNLPMTDKDNSVKIFSDAISKRMIYTGVVGYVPSKSISYIKDGNRQSISKLIIDKNNRLLINGEWIDLNKLQLYYKAGTDENPIYENYNINYDEAFERIVYADEYTAQSNATFGLYVNLLDDGLLDDRWNYAELNTIDLRLYNPLYNNNPLKDVPNYMNEVTGIALNNYVVLENKSGELNFIFNPNDEKYSLGIQCIEELEKSFFVFYKTEQSNEDSTTYKYILLISKKFYGSIASINADVYDKIKDYIIINRMIYFPQFHYCEEFLPNNELTLDDFVITKKDALFVIPTIEFSKTKKNGNVKFLYGEAVNLDNIMSWEFYNRSTNQKFVIKDSIQEPFIANDKYDELPNGYYDVTFNYSLKNDSKYHNLSLNSAFIKK